MQSNKYAFLTGQESWDIYFKSGFKEKCNFKNPYSKKKNLNYGKSGIGVGIQTLKE